MCSEKPKYHLEMFNHVKLAINKIGVDMVYTLFSSTAISVADGIYVKQTLFSFSLDFCIFSLIISQHWILPSEVPKLTFLFSVFDFQNVGMVYALISSTAVSMISNPKEVNLSPANIFQPDEVRL